MRQSSFLTLSAAALTAAMGTAQNQDYNAAGYGGSALAIDVDAATGNNGHLGCVYAGGVIHVSSRILGGGTGTPHTVYVFDNAGNIQPAQEYSQSAFTAGSAWGWRDGATDDIIGGTTNFWGSEVGFELADQSGNSVNSYLAGGGARTLNFPQPIGGGVLAAALTIRALAYDPTGDAGNGSWYTANFGGDIYEFDRDGNVLSNVSGGWTAYGLALDVPSGNLLVSAGSVNDYTVSEIDPATGVETGNTFERPDRTGIYGGLSPMDTPPVTPFYNPNVGFTGMVSLTQGNAGALTDTLAVHRLHDVLPGVLGYDEAFLSIGINGGGLSSRATLFAGDTIDVLVDGNGSVAPGFPTWTAFNYAPQATLPGVLAKTSTNINVAAPALGLGILHEFVRQNPISVPQQDPNVLIVGHAVGAPLNLPTPANLPVGRGDIVGVQSIHLQPGGPAGPFKATNEVFLDGDAPTSGIDVKAEGANSFNAVTTSGFFSVEHKGGSFAALTIDNVQFDWATSSVAGQATMVFDTDQISMADQFDGGDSTATGCLGTYRNGSDSLIDFAATAAQASACAAFNGTGAGFLGSNPTTAPSYRTIDMPNVAGAFGVGQTLEFDCDTDGGLGVTGDAMEGMVVTITLSDASVVTGELQVDPFSLNTALLNFP